MTNTHFTYDQDIVTDPNTGLMWQRHISKKIFTLETAKLYAADLRLGGYEGWRVPNKAELLSIVDHSRRNPAIDIEAFPNTPSEYFWTVSPVASNSNGAWIVLFNNGDSSSYYDVSYFSRVRCVR